MAVTCNAREVGNLSSLRTANEESVGQPHRRRFFVSSDCLRSPTQLLGREPSWRSGLGGSVSSLFRLYTINIPARHHARSSRSRRAHRTGLRHQPSLMDFSSLWEMLLERRPLLLYAAAWTALLTTAVAVASFVPEAAFVWAVSPSSSFSRSCQGAGYGVAEFVRVPLDVPGEVLCLPARLFGRSKLDLLVPPVFAALVVAAAASFVRAVGLWDEEDEATTS